MKDAGRPPAEAGAAADMQCRRSACRVRAAGFELQGGTTGVQARRFEVQGCVCGCGPLGCGHYAGQAPPRMRERAGGRGRVEPGRALRRVHAVRATRCCVLCGRTCDRRAEARVVWGTTGGWAHAAVDDARARLCVGGPTRPRTARGGPAAPVCAVACAHARRSADACVQGDEGQMVQAEA